MKDGHDLILHNMLPKLKIILIVYQKLSYHYTQGYVQVWGWRVKERVCVLRILRTAQKIMHELFAKNYNISPKDMQQPNNHRKKCGELTQFIIKSYIIQIALFILKVYLDIMMHFKKHLVQLSYFYKVTFFLTPEDKHIIKTHIHQ